MKRLFLTVAVIVVAALGVYVYWRQTNRFYWISYNSPEVLAKGGNFSFLYPSVFEIASDEWRIDLKGERHAIIFKEKDSEPDAAAVLEVNAEKGLEACTGYDACQAVQGIAIGIKGGSEKLQSLLPEIIASFKVLESGVGAN